MKSKLQVCLLSLGQKTGKSRSLPVPSLLHKWSDTCTYLLCAPDKLETSADRTTAKIESEKQQL